MTSFIGQVKTPGDTDWVGNGLRFGTREQAEAYVSDLAWKWSAVRETKVAQSEKEPNYVFLDGEAKPLP